MPRILPRLFSETLSIRIIREIRGPETHQESVVPQSTTDDADQKQPRMTRIPRIFRLFVFKKKKASVSSVKSVVIFETQESVVYLKSVVWCQLCAGRVIVAFHIRPAGAGRRVRRKT